MFSLGFSYNDNVKEERAGQLMSPPPSPPPPLPGPPHYTHAHIHSGAQAFSRSSVARLIVNERIINPSTCHVIVSTWKTWRIVWVNLLEWGVDDLFSRRLSRFQLCWVVIIKIITCFFFIILSLWADFCRLIGGKMQLEIHFVAISLSKNSRSCHSYLPWLLWVNSLSVSITCWNHLSP